MRKIKGFGAWIMVLVTVLTLLAPVVPQASAAGKVYYNIDFSAKVAKTTIHQQVNGDCGIVSMATIEAYLHGATSASDRKIVYQEVLKKNNNSYNSYANWGNVGYTTGSVNWDKIYDQLASGYPCIIHRASGHYAVVAGYKGSTSKLEADKFIMVDVRHTSNPYPTTNQYVETVGSWRAGSKIDGFVYRKNGIPITGLSGIRMAINVPKYVHPYGEGHGVYGQISSNKNLTSIVLQVVNAKTGELAYSLSKTPNAKSFNIFNNWDSTLQFKSLPKGEYYYTVQAKNADGVTKNVKRYFIVSSSWPATRPAEPSYTLQFDGNGGSGTAPAAKTLSYYSSTLALPENTFTRSGYKFLGWSVKRTPDNKWFCYTDSSGTWAWLTESQMKEKGLTARIYDPGYSIQFSWPWIKDCGYLGATLTFYAQWEQTCAEHTWDDGVLTIEPSIYSDGLKTFTCTTCGGTRTETVPKLDPAPDAPYKLVNVVSGVHVYWKTANNAVKYELYRSEDMLLGYTRIATTTATHFIDTTAVSGKVYNYRVKTVSDSGNISGYSDLNSITFVGTPDITSRFNKAAGITLGWNKIEGATGYAIYRKSYSGTDAWVRVATISGNSTFTWQDTSVKDANGAVYRYTVRALAGYNMKTLSGCRNTGRTMARLTSRNLNSALKTSGTSIKCNWTTSAAVTGYEVRFMVGDQVYKTFTVGSYKTGIKTFTDLPMGKTYKIQVRSYLKVDGMGFYSAWSTPQYVAL